MRPRGKLLWKFDSGLDLRGPNRGVTYWAEGDDRRIFAAAGSFVYALDARTGKAIAGFGRDGRIDLREDLGRDPAQQSVALTTPGVIYKDLLIVGGRTAESLPASPGDIRAYDVRTGKLRWSFHTIPHPGEFGYDTWPKDAWTYIGSANNWAGMAVDQKRGIVYAPTGSAAADFYGANRLGDNLFANTLLALDANTGKRIWHFQAVKHDLWDRDFPSPPNLVTVRQNGRMVDAVAQTTKHGYVFLFDRTTGKPLFPIEVAEVPGEHGAGRGGRGNAAAADAAGAVRAADADGEHADQSHSGSAPVGAGAVPEIHQRGTVRAAERGQGHGRFSRASTAARSGAARPSIRRAGCSTSIRPRWRGLRAWRIAGAGCRGGSCI